MTEFRRWILTGLAFPLVAAGWCAGYIVRVARLARAAYREGYERGSRL